MKLMPMLTVAALAIAAVAVVVATWASVADAPWEADPEEIIVRESAPAPAPAIPIEVPNTDVKCVAAISDRESARRSLRFYQRRGGQANDSTISGNQRRVDRAQDDVDRYC